MSAIPSQVRVSAAAVTGVSLTFIVLSLCSSVSGQPDRAVTESKNGCTSRCERCNTTLAVCDQCGPGFFFNVDTFKCQAISTALTGCQYYLLGDYCTGCVEGYKLDRLGCSQCVAKNCKVCTTNVNTCDECLDGFSRSTATVVDCDLKCTVANCKTCAIGNAAACSVCLNGYRLNAALACDKCTISNCVSCAISQTLCDEKPLPQATCFNNSYYDYKLKTCTGCAASCLNCNANGTCSTCNTTGGFTMSTTGSCVGNTAPIWSPPTVILLALFVHYLG